MDLLKQYTDEFARLDEECYQNDIPNADAFAFLDREIPRFECPDKDLERTYYFRFWTYRKHIKHTKDGWIITEFLPKVPWSGEYNTINAAAGHHIYEGRWMKNGGRILWDYIRFFLARPEGAHQYSCWLADAAWKLAEVTGKFDQGRDFVRSLCAYYEEWERTHGLDSMFWSVDNYDAMEYSISGRGSTGLGRPGIRPTLNSYLCADALAISRFADAAGDPDTAARYLERHEQLKRQINEKLWDDGFYRAFHFDEGQYAPAIFDTVCNRPRELIGYIPWMFGIPVPGREEVFGLLLDGRSFLSEQGMTTAERSHPEYLYKANHECLWNGYVWPFAVSQTLTALNNVIRTYPGGEKFRGMFADLLIRYARNHVRTREDGVTVPWIDEVRHPERDEWSSREMLKNWGWEERRGGYERGKDYNHSTFCDLVISGLCGIGTDGETLTADPILPECWDYLKLSGIPFRGRLYCLIYDRDGTKYGLGSGVRILPE